MTSSSERGEKMKHWFFILFVGILITGCASSRPIHQSHFECRRGKAGQAVGPPVYVDAAPCLLAKHIAKATIRGDAPNAVLVIDLNKKGKQKLVHLIAKMSHKEYIVVLLSGEPVPSHAVKSDPGGGTITVDLGKLSQTQIRSAKALAEK